jgi:hypothetical protein
MAFLLSDYLETQLPEEKAVLSNLRLKFAWILTGILMLTIFINFLFTFVSIAISKLKYLMRKIKNSKKSFKMNFEIKPEAENKN